MKVIHTPRRFIASEWGGTETTILQLSRSMNRMGHDAQIITSMALATQRHEMMQGVPIHRYPYCYPFFGLSQEDLLNMDKKGGNLLSFSLFAKLLREPGVDIMHAHTGKRLGGIVRTAARMRRIPYVITLHGGVFDVPKGEMQQMLAPISNSFEWGKPFGALFGSRRVLQDAAAVICVGENESKAAQQALPDQRIECIPNGVDTEFFAQGDGARFRKQHGIADHKKIMLCLSRIDYQKNQIGLVEALPAVLAEEPDAHLLIVGPVTVASYAEKLKARIQALKLESSVTILAGIQPGEQMLADAYHAANLFCLPSLHEPFGIVILEAWASRCPVVAAHVGGIPSFTRHGENILHFNPENKDDIAKSILTLLSNPELSQKLAVAGQQQAKQHYDWDAVAGTLLKLYSDIIEQKSSSR